MVPLANAHLLQQETSKCQQLFGLQVLGQFPSRAARPQPSPYRSLERAGPDRALRAVASSAIRLAQAPSSTPLELPGVTLPSGRTRTPLSFVILGRTARLDNVEGC